MEFHYVNYYIYEPLSEYWHFWVTMEYLRFALLGFTWRLKYLYHAIPSLQSIVSLLHTEPCSIVFTLIILCMTFCLFLSFLPPCFALIGFVSFTDWSSLVSYLVLCLSTLPQSYVLDYSSVVFAIKCCLNCILILQLLHYRILCHHWVQRIYNSFRSSHCGLSGATDYWL